MARPAWQLCLAARVSKYGISIEQALWHLPLAVVQQLILFDDIVAGHRPKWASATAQGVKDLDTLLAEALTTNPMA